MGERDSSSNVKSLSPLMTHPPISVSVLLYRFIVCFFFPHHQFTILAMTTTTFGHLPVETVSLIFSFLDSLDSLYYRRVSKSWRQRLFGCASISCNVSSMSAFANVSIDGVRLKGSPPEDEEANHSSILDRKLLPFHRTKGQLPEPRVLSSRNQVFCEKPLEFCARGNSIAFRMEGHGNQLVWDTVDLSLSSCLMTRLARIQPLPGAPFVLCQKRTKPLLKRIILRADLSGVQHLKRLSLRGCTQLQVLHLSPGLEALDVSSCSNLTTIVFPMGQTRELEALNLRGCRSLEAQDRTRLFGAATADVMRHVKDFDLSSTKRLDTTVVADAIRMACALESLSLRYIASDPIIRALADSEASKTTLRYLDVSFSEDLKDEACESLVNSAIYLERFNLRACKCVSAALYNGVPMWLQNRSDDTSARFSSNSTSNTNTSSRPSRRKGDVIFQFTSS